MASSIKNILAGVNIGEGNRLRSVKDSSNVEFSKSFTTNPIDLHYSNDPSSLLKGIHGLKLEHKGPSNVSTGVLETLVSQSVMEVEASPFKESENLIAYGGSDHQLTILRHTLSLGPTSREGGIRESIQFSHVANFSTSGKTTCISWSPLSFSDQHQTSVSLSIACSDHSLHYYFATENTSLSNSFTGHTDYINSVSFVPSFSSSNSNSIQLASTSDDHSVLLWNLEKNFPLQELPLSSSGVAVKFHPQCPNMMMVAESAGQLQLFDLRVPFSPCFTLFAPSFPILDADWNPSDPNLFGATCKNQWMIWNCDNGTSGSGNTAALAGPASSPGNIFSKFRWSRNNPHLFATSSSPSSFSIWDYKNPSSPYSQWSSTSRFGGLSWFSNRSCLLAASHRNIYFTVIPSS